MDELEELPPIASERTPRTGGQSAFDFSFPSNILPEQQEEEDMSIRLTEAVWYGRQNEVRNLVSSGSVSDTAILRQVFSTVRSRRLAIFKALIEPWSNTAGFGQWSQIVKNLCISLHLPSFYDIVQRVDEVSRQDYLVAARKGSSQTMETIALNLRKEGKLNDSLQKKALQLATREGNEDVLDFLLTY